MAKVSINHNQKTDVTGDAEFDHIGISLSDLKGYMGVKFNNKTIAGNTDLVAVYESFDVAGKLNVIEFMKKMTVNCFNDAMGTTYTWDQVPDSIFG